MRSGNDRLLFVYGTLMKGHPMHRLLRPLGRFVAEAEAAGALVLLDGYPGLVTGEGRVRGELYRLHRPAEALKRLDRYEGCLPGDPLHAEYRRARIEATTRGGRRLTAWAYLYQGPTTDRPAIPDGDFRALPAATLRHARALAGR